MNTIPMPPIDWAVTVPLLVIFGWATALLLIDVFFVAQDKKRITGFLALGGLVVTALACIPLIGIESTTLSGMLRLDGFALALIWIFCLLGALSIAMAIDYLPRQGIEQGEFYPLMLFAVGAMIALVQSTSLIAIFLSVELLSITLYILTGFAYPRLASEEAGMKYLVLGAFAAGFFVYGIALVYGATGSIDLGQIAAVAGASDFTSGNRMLLLAGGAMILVAFGFKVSLAPFQMWTPDVYEGAPTPATAFMSVGTKAAAYAALLRILQTALPATADVWMPVIGALAVLTMLVGNIGAVVQRNVKRMLAYSSIGHAGYIALALVAAPSAGSFPFIFYLLAYGVSNLGVFAVVIALEREGESNWELSEFSGLFARRPGLAVAMAICLLSLAGIPPTAGFFGKLAVFGAAYDAGFGVLALVGVISSAIAAGFYLRLIGQMFTEQPSAAREIEAGRPLQVGLVVAVAGTLLLGLVSFPIATFVEGLAVGL